MPHERLRIVHVIARLNVGGAALHVLQLAREQQRRGHDVARRRRHARRRRGVDGVRRATSSASIVLQLPALQRELSLRARLGARSARCARIIAARRPDVLHTHTAKAGATGRLAALAVGRARPRGVVHTYHGHVLSGYFEPARERVFRAIERVLARTSGDARSPSATRCATTSSASASRRRERFVVIPYGFDLPPWSDADDERARAIRAELGVGDDDVRRRLGGPADGDQAAARPRPDAARARATTASTRCSSSSATARSAPRRRRSRASSASPTAAASSASSRASARWYAASTRSLLTSANEGTPVVAIEALAAERPVVATRRRRHGDRRHGTARAATSRRSATSTALAARLATLARDPELRARLGARGARRTCATASRRRGWPTRSRRSTAAARREGPPRPQAHRRQRLGGPPARAAARAARARASTRASSASTCPAATRRDFYDALDGSASRTARVRCGARREPADGARRRPRRPRGAARPPAHPPRPRRRLRRRRGARCSGSRSSRRGTTTTATCSARSATSTAPSRAARGG